MEHYDDVLQFVTKTGAHNLNYRSFESAAFIPGNSRWKLINQVASFDRETAEFSRTPNADAACYPYGDKLVGRSEPGNPVQRLSTVESVNELHGTARDGSIRDLSHLFLKTQNPAPAAEKEPASPLSLLLERIGA
ncbi:hypothetical protein [Rheinheimera sp.]|uniref:hypothetical protein n=1 Tax=Rheinheimera sp. TaxID=1869214 RepID=UPI00307ECF04